MDRKRVDELRKKDIMDHILVKIIIFERNNIITAHHS